LALQTLAKWFCVPNFGVEIWNAKRLFLSALPNSWPSYEGPREKILLAFQISTLKFGALKPFCSWPSKLKTELRTAESKKLLMLKSSVARLGGPIDFFSRRSKLQCRSLVTKSFKKKSILHTKRKQETNMKESKKKTRNMKQGFRVYSTLCITFVSVGNDSRTHLLFSTVGGA
jgi:hypothetical protein